MEKNILPNAVGYKKFLGKEENLKKILIICGSGASSGFIAQNIRKAAKSKGLEISVKAVSDTELEDYLPDYDLVLVGPHLKHRMVEIRKIVEPYHIEANIIDQKHYATLDGASILDEALKSM
jgi:PTS system cellobiose-specific IIB component